MDAEAGKLWKKATNEEMVALDNNGVINRVDLWVGIKPIGNKWMFKKKLNEKEKWRNIKLS